MGRSDRDRITRMSCVTKRGAVQLTPMYSTRPARSMRSIAFTASTTRSPEFNLSAEQHAREIHARAHERACNSEHKASTSATHAVPFCKCCHTQLPSVAAIVLGFARDARSIGSNGPGHQACRKGLAELPIRMRQSTPRRNPGERGPSSLACKSDRSCDKHFGRDSIDAQFRHKLMAGALIARSCDDVCSCEHKVCVCSS
eukprot:scaffold38249_cov30-Tisochrysis_lutea.AAC.4